MLKAEANQKKKSGLTQLGYKSMLNNANNNTFKKTQNKIYGVNMDAAISQLFLNIYDWSTHCKHEHLELKIVVSWRWCIAPLKKK